MLSSRLEWGREPRSGKQQHFPIGPASAFALILSMPAQCFAKHYFTLGSPVGKGFRMVRLVQLKQLARARPVPLISQLQLASRASSTNMPPNLRVWKHKGCLRGPISPKCAASAYAHLDAFSRPMDSACLVAAMPKDATYAKASTPRKRPTRGLVARQRDSIHLRAAHNCDVSVQAQ